MITEGDHYEEKLIKMNPILNKRNRYKDILPCKFLFLFRDEFNNVKIFGKTENLIEESDNYINASFINVKYLLNLFLSFRVL
jgi:protein tyrosine phosphatase